MPVVAGHTLNAARDALGTYFETEWGLRVTSPAIQIAWANEDFDPQASGVKGVGYIRLRFVPGDSVPVGLKQTGGKKWRQFGVAAVDLFWPLHAGETDAWTKAEVVVDIFAGRTISGIRFRDVSPVGSEAGEDWFQISLSVEFNYDIHRT